MAIGAEQATSSVRCHRSSLEDAAGDIYSDRVMAHMHQGSHHPPSATSKIQHSQSKFRSQRRPDEVNLFLSHNTVEENRIELPDLSTCRLHDRAVVDVALLLNNHQVAPSACRGKNRPRNSTLNGTRSGRPSR